MTAYGYDAADHMVTVTNPLEQVTEVTYDPAGIVTAITTPGAVRQVMDMMAIIIRHR